LAGSSRDGRISVGAGENRGFLIFYVRRETMQTLVPGSYVGDVRAVEKKTGLERVCLTLDLQVVEGITR
jgi:hypothetical protein